MTGSSSDCLVLFFLDDIGAWFERREMGDVYGLAASEYSYQSRRLRYFNQQSVRPRWVEDSEVVFAVAETVHRERSEDADATQIDEFFKAILASKALKPDEKREIETLARVSAEHRSILDVAQDAAAHQARKIYKCAVCGLEFIGILSFTDHNEATSHMRNQGRVW
jgi:rubrerythrin